MLRVSLRSLAKVTTGYTNFPVVPNAKAVLVELYTKTLQLLTEFPADAGYRINTERITRHRLKCVQASSEIEAFEQAIGCGQAEELIEQANDELELIPILQETKCWEKTTVPAL